MEILNKNITTNVSAVILSAGKSERFGVPKAYLVFDEYRSFIQNLLHEYHKAGIKDIVVVTSNPLKTTMTHQLVKASDELDIKMVINQDPEKGRFSSIKLGLQYIDPAHDVFIQNVDNPFTDALLLRHMVNEIAGENYVVPEFDGINGHPVLLSREIAKEIRLMDADEKDLRQVLGNYPARPLRVNNPAILANINTPDEYRRYFHHVTAH